MALLFAVNALFSLNPRLSRVNVPVTGLNPALEGYTLLHLSDLKGKEINYQRVAREVRFSYPEIKSISIGKGAEVDDSLKVTDRTIIIARSAKPMPASQIKKVEEWLQLRLEDSTAVVHNIVEGKKR